MMAYRDYHRESSEIYSSSISCLDGVAFKIGSQFIPPNKVILPPDLLTTRSSRSTSNDEYTFEVEEGVLLWADEREKQLEAQLRLEEERRVVNQTQDVSSEDSEPDEWLALSNQNTKPAKELPPPPPVPRKPMLVTSDILTPTPINPELTNHTETQNKNVDVTLFEKEDDPFDMFERQTLNDFEELKSVFSTADNEQTDEAEPPTYENVEIKNNSQVSFNCRSNGEEGEYVQLQNGGEPKSETNAQIDNLPPVSQSRNFLVGKNPLPPIGRPVDTTGSQMPFNVDSNVVVQNSQQTVSQTGPIYSNTQPIYENTSVLQDQKPYSKNHNLNRYCRNDLNSSELGAAEGNFGYQPNLYVNIEAGGAEKHSGMRNALSSPDLATRDGSDAASVSPIFMSRSPPPRPSSQQSWNKYSPLPDPKTEKSMSHSSSSSSGDLVSPTVIDPYLRLNPEGQKAVNSLAGMGFSRPQAARAVERFGEDEKEVIEYLCSVSKLADQGFDPYQAETILLLYNNNIEKSEQYLNLFKQFAELGFCREKIKEALVSNELDRDKALDYLTA